MIPLRTREHIIPHKTHQQSRGETLTWKSFTIKLKATRHPIESTPLDLLGKVHINITLTKILKRRCVIVYAIIIAKIKIRISYSID